MKGFCRKLITEHDSPVQYYLPLGEQRIHLNPLVGSELVLIHTGIIQCSHCGRGTKKSYSQGYCYPCFKKLPQCDLCMMSPERCHFDAGTCRDEEFGERVCMQPHIVYLANSSGMKVGITRLDQIPTRWIDQGAVQGIPLFETHSRQIAGFLEVMMKQHISDRTQWQKMLKSENAHVDLEQEKSRLLDLVGEQLEKISERFGAGAFKLAPKQETTVIQYPVEYYPTKIKSLSFDKTAEVSGKLLGVKGQYLILDTGVINIRKFSAYELELQLGHASLF